MKKVLILIFILFSTSIIWSQQTYEGSAAAGSYGYFPANGLYAASSAFPANSIVDVLDPASGKSVRVVITGPLDQPGFFILLSDGAIRALGMSSADTIRVRVTSVSTPGIASILDSRELAYSDDPDVNPVADFSDPNDFIYTPESTEPKDPVVVVTDPVTDDTSVDPVDPVADNTVDNTTDNTVVVSDPVADTVVDTITDTVDDTVDVSVVPVPDVETPDTTDDTPDVAVVDTVDDTITEDTPDVPDVADTTDSTTDTSDIASVDDTASTVDDSTVDDSTPDAGIEHNTPSVSDPAVTDSPVVVYTTPETSLPETDAGSDTVEDPDLSPSLHDDSVIAVEDTVETDESPLRKASPVNRLNEQLRQIITRSGDKNRNVYPSDSVAETSVPPTSPEAGEIAADYAEPGLVDQTGIASIALDHINAPADDLSDIEMESLVFNPDEEGEFFDTPSVPDTALEIAIEDQPILPAVEVAESPELSETQADPGYDYAGVVVNEPVVFDNVDPKDEFIPRQAAPEYRQPQVLAMHEPVQANEFSDVLVDTTDDTTDDATEAVVVVTGPDASVAGDLEPGAEDFSSMDISEPELVGVIADDVERVNPDGDTIEVAVREPETPADVESEVPEGTVTLENPDVAAVDVETIEPGLPGETVAVVVDDQSDVESGPDGSVDSIDPEDSATDLSDVTVNVPEVSDRPDSSETVSKPEDEVVDTPNIKPVNPEDLPADAVEIVLEPTDPKYPDPVDTTEDAPKDTDIKTTDVVVDDSSTVVDPGLAVPVRRVSRLQSRINYLQLGVYSSEKSAVNKVQSIDGNFPYIVLPVESNGKELYKLMVGPLEEDEKGLVMYWFRAKGFSDAFIRVGE